MSDKIKENRPSEIIYQIYPASFKDANNDGHGDLKGITEELEYIKNLGVDAVWISPFFQSPAGAKGDGGYAISDYQKIDTRFGDMEDFEELLAKAHEKGLRVYTDFVMCHTCDEHEWFEKSRNREPGFEDRYVWSSGKKDMHGNLILVNGKPIPPNNWKSVFESESGRKDQSAWSFDEKRQEFYLHHFNTSQPALNSNSIATQDAIMEEMKFWLDKGVDGLRLDALPFANYDPQLRDNPGGDTWDSQYFEHSMCQQSTVDFVARIRDTLDEYEKKGLGKRVAIGEAIAGKNSGYNSMEIAKDYVHPETGLTTCYTEPKFWPSWGKPSGYPSSWELKEHLNNIEHYFPSGAMCNYLSNHDFSRAATRMLPQGCPEELRTTVLKQLMALNLSLPGSVCVYQGEELGLPDARIPEDIPEDKMQDRLDKKNRRDKSRATMPWNSNLPNAGFSSADNPYLPTPESYIPRAVDLQEAEPNSMLQHFRDLIADRQNNPALQVGATEILNTPEPIFAFTRKTDEQTILFVSNQSPYPQKIKPVDFLSAEDLKKLHMTADSEIIVGAYDFSRRGLIASEKSHHPSEQELANGHKGKKIFAADMLIADVFHHNQTGELGNIIQKNNWKPAQRISIDKNTHEQLLNLTNDQQKVTVGGSTLLTLDTLKRLQPEADISIDYMGMAGEDKYGKLVKEHVEKDGIKLLTPHWPEGMKQETAISHIIKTDSHDIVATYAGTEAQGLQETLKNNRTLLEASIAKSDIVYLPGSLTEKFGQSFIDEILRLRWIHKKELVLALPVHATFGPSDAQTFRGLIRSANKVVGNDLEYCRIFGVEASRPTNDEQMAIVTKKIQESFQEEVLQNNNMPCDTGQVALITRGNQGAILVLKDKIINIPPFKTENAVNLIGSGDASTAAFIDAELRGLSHEQAARFGMAMGAEKAQQADESPYIIDLEAARKRAFSRKNMQDVAAAYAANDPDYQQKSKGGRG